jgi:L-iditol 2-dehydrogenase
VKAAVYHAPGDVRLEEVERPVPGPGEVLVAMRACGICGSDLLEWYVERKAPAVLGHEPVGVVVERGSPPPGGSLPAVGRRVFVHHHVPCLRCERCRRGHETLCEQFRATRIVPGGFAELILVPAANAALDVLEVPDGVGDAGGTAIEPLACGVRALRRARVGPGTRLLLVGGGPMGLLTASAALAGRARVAVAEPLAERRAVAEQLGAAAVEPDPGAVAEALGGRPTVVMLCTSAPAAWGLATGVVDHGGRIQLFAPGALDERRAFDVNDLFFREIEIQASYSAGPADTRAALDLIASGAVAPERLVTHRFPLDRLADALATARRREGIKVIVTAGEAA